MYLTVIFLMIISMVASIAVLFIKDILGTIIVTGMVSFVAALIFLALAAPDVAITEASIGAALTMVIFMVALSRTKTSGD